MERNIFVVDSIVNMRWVKLSCQTTTHTNSQQLQQMQKLSFFVFNEIKLATFYSQHLAMRKIVFLMQ